MVLITGVYLLILIIISCSFFILVSYGIFVYALILADFPVCILVAIFSLFYTLRGGMCEASGADEFIIHGLVIAVGSFD